MSNFISVLFLYGNKETKINDSLLNMETLYLVCKDKENGIEFPIECVEQENEYEYTIQILVEEEMFEGITNTLAEPTKAIVGSYGEEIKLDVNKLIVVEVLDLDKDEYYFKAKYWLNLLVKQIVAINQMIGSFLFCNCKVSV